MVIFLTIRNPLHIGFNTFILAQFWFERQALKLYISSIYSAYVIVNTLDIVFFAINLLLRLAVDANKFNVKN